MKVTRSDSIAIAKNNYNRIADNQIDDINYEQWIDFVENHKNYFIWYEDTEGGISTKNNIDKVPDWAKEGTIRRLNKLCAYCTKEISIHQYDLVICYGLKNKRLSVSIEKKMTKKIAEILIEMAQYLDAKVIINGRKVLENVEQLE